MLYFEKPIFILLPVLLLVWQLAVYLLKKKLKMSLIADFLLTAFTVVAHAASITVIFINEGALSDALALVLLSGVFSLLFSPKHNATENKVEEDEN